MHGVRISQLAFLALEALLCRELQLIVIGWAHLAPGGMVPGLQVRVVLGLCLVVAAIQQLVKCSV
jgi:hypothetical protein